MRVTASELELERKMRRETMTTARELELKDAVLLPLADGSEYDPEAVAQVLERAGVTRAEFRYLDEKPGLWGYRVGPEQKEWHWKLRRLRNDEHARLMAALG